jgi:tetratricopeptide (TPR) repeat protein
MRKSENDELVKQMHVEADKLFHNGIYPIAARVYTQIVQLNPRDAKALHNKACCFYYSEDYETALKWFNLTLLFKLDATTIYMKACVLGRLGRFLEAVVCCDSAIETDDASDAQFSNCIKNFRLRTISKLSPEKIALYYRSYYPLTKEYFE